MLSLGPCQEQPVQVCAQGLAWRSLRGGPGDQPVCPRGWRPQQPPRQQPFMRDFLQIKGSFALISFAGAAVCAFQDKPSGWLPLPGSSSRTVERGGLHKKDYSSLKAWGIAGSLGVL